MKADSSSVGSVRFKRLRAVRVHIPAGQRVPLYKGPGPGYGVAGSAWRGAEFVIYGIDVGEDGKAYYAIVNRRAWIASENVRDITNDVFAHCNVWKTTAGYLLSGVIVVLSIMIVIAAIYLLTH